jgi:vacuole morphology and inheritance protein 14
MAAKDREKDYGPLPPLIAKGLNDKLYEKRKTAALDLERTIKELNALGDWKQIDDIAFVLNQEFIQIPNANSKKGGLIGLAATAIALGIEAGKFTERLMPPVLSCFHDQDSRVRYYACEALYNIAKVSRRAILPYFTQVFDDISKV